MKPDNYSVSSHLTDTLQLTLNKKVCKGIGVQPFSHKSVHCHLYKKAGLLIVFWSKSTILVLAPQLDTYNFMNWQLYKTLSDMLPLPHFMQMNRLGYLVHYDSIFHVLVAPTVLLTFLLVCFIGVSSICASNWLTLKYL